MDIDIGNIKDLDILRPQAQYIHMNGKNIDVSFVPCGITFEVDKIVNALGKIKKEQLTSESQETHKALDLSIELCALFCSHKYPEMDSKWFRQNVDAVQLKVFVNAIKTALYKSYAGVLADSKN